MDMVVFIPLTILYLPHKVTTNIVDRKIENYFQELRDVMAILLYQYYCE